jgi:hypothetical protein
MLQQVLQTNLSQSDFGLFLRFVGFGQMIGGRLTNLIQGDIGGLAVRLAPGSGISLGLGALDGGLAEGVQDSALLLNDVRFGHGHISSGNASYAALG